MATPAESAAAQNEPAAFLVFPAVLTETAPESGVDVESLVSVSNTSDTDLVIHVSFVNGETGPDACAVCDLAGPVVLAGKGSVTVSVRRQANHATLEVFNETLSTNCPFSRGFITVHPEDDSGNTLYDNVLIGKQIVVDYDGGQAFAIPAIAFQAISGTDGNHVFDFDGVEYEKFPRMVAGEFLAPNLEGHAEPGGFDVFLTLFTLDFQNHSPPLVDCSVIGWDAHSQYVSSSFQFGCWAQIKLSDISSAYAYPYLGNSDGTPDENGWVQINCRVDTNPAAADGFEVDGGVHGSLHQLAPTATVLRREEGGPPLSNAGAWGRVLPQSVTTGDDTAFTLDAPGRRNK